MQKPRRIIGLLGGSFNPAHAGHLHISLYALNRLGLAEIWWLVSPHNPLKSKDDLGDYDLRVAKAQAIAQHPRIKILTLEQERGLRFTYQTLDYIRQHFPRYEFVWLMGADNLAGFHRWQRWQAIARKIPVWVFDRAPYSYSSLGSRAGQWLGKISRQDKGLGLARFRFIRLRRHPASASNLRKTLGKAGSFRHNKTR